MAKNSFNISNDDIVLIPEGLYELGYVGYSTITVMGKTPKIALKFKIVEYGDYFEKTLIKYYGVRRLNSKPGKSGGFTAGKCSNFLRDFFRFFPDQRLPRCDRIPMTRFKEVTLVGRVNTVVKGFDQKPIPEQLQYSVIRELIEVKRL